MRSCKIIKLQAQYTDWPINITSLLSGENNWNIMNYIGTLIPIFLLLLLLLL